MSNKRLTCPFCGGEVKILVCDDEGNLHPDEYENDPWSGLGFKLYHDETMTNGQDCPIAGHEGEGTLGMYIYDTREEAIKYWNTRKPMERIVERLTEEVEYQKKKADEADVLEKVSVSNTRLSMRNCYKHAIEIVKGGGVDEVG